MELTPQQSTDGLLEVGACVRHPLLSRTAKTFQEGHVDAAAARRGASRLSIGFVDKAAESNNPSAAREIDASAQPQPSSQILVETSSRAQATAGAFNLLESASVRGFEKTGRSHLERRTNVVG